MKITYKGDEVSSNVYFNDNPLKKMTEISDDGEIRIALNQLIQNGDTLEVNIDKFILCKEKPLNIGNINLIFVPR